MRKKLTSVEPPETSGICGLDFKIITQIGSKKGSNAQVVAGNGKHHRSHKSQIFEDIVMPNYESSTVKGDGNTFGSK